MTRLIVILITVAAAAVGTLYVTETYPAGETAHGRGDVGSVSSPGIGSSVPPAPEEPLAQYFIRRFRRDTGARNAVAAIYLNYRVYDTLFEALLLLIAIVGIVHFFRVDDTTARRPEEGSTRSDDRVGHAPPEAGAAKRLNREELLP